MTLLTRSQPVALLGEAPPRAHVAPPRTRANSWQDVSDLSAAFGITLDEWQEVVLQHAMGERPDGTWAARRVGLSVPRQNGKSQLLVARALAGALLFGEKKIVISAHQQDTARESFSKLMEIIDADANATLRARVKSVMNALNREAVRFNNGSAIQFKARSGSGSRGFSSDCLMLDEAQILSQRAWVSINSTMSAMPNPQVWLLGTPPTPEDDGEVFGSVRRSATDAGSTSVAWLEWAADPKAPDFDPASEYTRWSANPAWNLRINHEVVQGEHETYPPDRFALDRLGIWASDVGSTRLITPDEWSATGTPEPPATTGIKTFGIAFSLDGSRVAVSGGLKHPDGIHVELVGAHSGSMAAGVASLADWLAERKDTTALYAIAGQAGAAVLAEALIARGAPRRAVHVCSSPEYFTSNAMFYDAVREGAVEAAARAKSPDRPRVPMLTHLASDGQSALDDSVSVSDKEAVGKLGSWRWKATTPDGDDTPVEAASLAHWAAKTTKRRPGRKTKAVIL